MDPISINNVYMLTMHRLSPSYQGSGLLWSEMLAFSHHLLFFCCLCYFNGLLACFCCSWLCHLCLVVTSALGCSHLCSLPSCINSPSLPLSSLGSFSKKTTTLVLVFSDTFLILLLLWVASGSNSICTVLHISFQTTTQRNTEATDALN